MPRQKDGAVLILLFDLSVVDAEVVKGERDFNIIITSSRSKEKVGAASSRWKEEVCRYQRQSETKFKFFEYITHFLARWTPREISRLEKGSRQKG